MKLHEQTQPRLLFVGFRGISWIARSAREDDPRIHTKPHEPYLSTE